MLTNPTDKMDLGSAVQGSVRPRRVLLPVDASSWSLQVVEKAGFLLEGTRTEIHLLFIQKPRDIPIRHDQRRQRAIEARARAARAFALANTILGAQGVASRHQAIMEGDPADCIFRYAEEVGADLVVVGRSGSPEPLGVLSGDPWRAIARRARYPMLVIRLSDEG
jgi:nucleotide-binding universal stress UspA family protein